MEELDITTSELLTVLQSAAEEGNNEEFWGVTREELETKLGWGKTKTLKYLRVCVERGLVKAVYVPRRAMHSMTHVKGYDLTKPA